MTRKIKVALRSKGGASYIDIVLMLIVAIMVIVFALNIFNYVIIRQDLDHIATKTAEAAALVGGISDDVPRDNVNDNVSIRNTFQEVCRAQGRSYTLNGRESANPNEVYYTITADRTFNNSNRVQLGDMITVTVGCKTQLSGFGALSNAGLGTYEITIQKVTLSRVYQKAS